MRRFFRRWSPDIETFRQQPWFSWLGSHVLHPRLWQLNRRSAARAVAIGLFCGLIPGPIQMLSAALASVLWRGFLPLSLAVTLYSNPLTIVPLYALAYGIGELLVGRGHGFTLPPQPHNGLMPWLGELALWIQGLGAPLLVGLVVLAVLLAAAGYCVVILGWRLNVARALAARRRRGS
ncbi:DUF2062 domain-containing protein [Niveibacterium sp. SC-1]|uniref:DUF2062 domain-containing protein n=1 Tax=Niveibacterium sp. SC-1 TaxID=3135646 RepID=UPI00311E76BD